MIRVINISGTTWTVIRGDENTTPVAHLIGFTVYQVATAGTLGQLQVADWVNAKTMFGATGGGSVDDGPAIASALSGATIGQTLYLPTGNFLVNSATAMTLAVPGLRIVGAGPKSTVITIGPSFSGSQVFTLGAEGCAVENLTIAGASSTTSSNPVANAFSLTGSRFCRIMNCEFQYVNGWCVESIAQSGNAGFATMLCNLSSYKTCAGGIHIKSYSGVNYGAQFFLSNLNFQQVGFGGVSSTSNLDAFFFEDCFDIMGVNFNAGISDAGTGSTMHIKGNCATIYLTNMDLGCFPNAASATNSVWLIEDNASAQSPQDIRIVNAVGQQGNIGFRITGGAKNIQCDNIRATNNYGHGFSIEGTGSSIDLIRVKCDSNGQGGAANSGTYYDINWPGTATGTVSGRLNSAVVSVGTNGVQHPVNANVGQQVRFDGIVIDGTGATTSNAFTQQPAYIRQVGISGAPARLLTRQYQSAGSSSGLISEIENTSSTPTAANFHIISAASGDRALGLDVHGDSNDRLSVDSAGKHSWGSGSATQDTTLYRSASGTLKTDGALVVGGTVTTANAAPFASTPGAPATTVSGTLVMMGLGSTWTFTPAGTGRLQIMVTGYGNTAVAATTFTVGPRFGTGTAPVNGAPVTGTRFGAPGDVTLKGPGIALDTGFSFTALLTGLTLSTAYWFDLALNSGNPADAAQVHNLSITITEI